MSDSLEVQRFVRTPFVVEATLITEENIDEIGKLIGEVKTKDGEKYIAIDRRIVPNFSRAYLGWYFTQMDDKYRCYAPKVFTQQFVAVGDKTEITIQLEDLPS